MLISLILQSVLKYLIFYSQKQGFPDKIESSMYTMTLWPKDTNLKITRSLCHGFECQSALSTAFLIPLCLAHFTEMQRQHNPVQSWWLVSKLQCIQKKKMCEWKLRGLSKHLFHRCLNNSPLAIHFHLNLESYISCYLFVFSWHLIMQSPQCCATFQMYSAVNERGWIYCPS